MLVAVDSRDIDHGFAQYFCKQRHLSCRSFAIFFAPVTTFQLIHTLCFSACDSFRYLPKRTVASRPIAGGQSFILKAVICSEFVLPGEPTHASRILRVVILTAKAILHPTEEPMMFEAITYKNAIGPGPLIDIGALAEGLLFYGRVAIVGNSATVKDLLARIPPFIVLSMLDDGRLEFHYLADQIGISTTQELNGRFRHSLVAFSSPDHTIEKIGSSTFMDLAGSTSQAKLGARKFAGLLRSLDHSGFDQPSVLQALSDRQAVNSSLSSLIREVVPNFGPLADLQFNIERESDGFYVDTNINFAELNRIYHQAVPISHSTLTEAYILSLLQGAYESTYFAALLNTEIAVHPIERAVQAKAVDAVVSRQLHSQSQIKSFVDLTLADGHAIREAVNSGAVPFTAVLKLLDSADKFRHWLHQQPPDTNLVRAYYQETIKDSWVEKLPAKSTRWSIFTTIGLGIDALGAGGLGTAASVAVSAVDAFVVDKLAKGWKPHQFVERDLKSLFTPGDKK